MTEGNTAPMRRPEFRVGSVLNRSVSIWGKNLVPFTLLAVIFQSPVLIYAHVKLSELALWTREDVDQYEAVTTWGQQLFGFILAGAVAYGVFRQLQGERAGFGKCLATGLSRFFSIVLVGILATLCMFLPFFVIMFFVGALLIQSAGWGGVVIAAAIGLFFLGLIATTLWVAVPVAVVERPGIVASLRRSAELTRGARLRIFGVMIVIFLFLFAWGILVGLISAGSEVDEVTSQWIQIGISLLFSTLYAVASAVAYHDLRTSKEGIGIAELIRVFE